MLLKPFTEVVEPLAFPIGGKVYETYGPSGPDWDLLTRIEAGTASEEERANVDVYALCVGADTWERMLADGVPFRAGLAAALACAAFARSGSHEVAGQVWEANLTGPVSTPAPAAETPAPAPVKKRAPRKAPTSV